LLTFLLIFAKSGYSFVNFEGIVFWLEQNNLLGIELQANYTRQDLDLQL
jgi:hypothetical protein